MNEARVMTRRTKPGIFVLGLLCALTVNGSCYRAEAAVPHEMAQAALPAGADWPLPPEGEELKVKPEHSQIYQIDAEPLANRSPLLLIHGGNGETQKFFRWGKVIERFNQDERFRKKYKVFLLRYDSNAPIEDVLPESESMIRKLYDSFGARPITVMALSLGGNVIQLAMANPDVEEAVTRVIAMATPFHGSPLFSADWFQYSLYKSHYFPLFRILDSLDYRLYFSWHKNYQQDLKWDDADDLVPQVGYFHSKLPFGPSGYLTVGRDTNPFLSEVNREHEVDKKKFTVYAGYLVNSYVLSKERDRLRYKLFSPFRFLSTQFRAQIGREQAALMVLNREISKVDAGPAGSSLEQGEHVYALNDGITPVSSAIYLPDRICRKHLLLRESDLLGILPFVDVAQARVFRNIDHVTFVEGNPPHHGSKLVRDSLHPEDGAHLIFDWMLAELLDADVKTVEMQTAASIDHSEGATRD